MQQVRKKSKELDHYLKSVINSVPKKLDDFVSGNDTKMTYYTGNWGQDLQDNLTERQAEKLRTQMSKLSEDLVFVSRKLPDNIGGYNYIAYVK